MGSFQVEGSRNVGMKKCVCIGVGQKVLGILWFIKLANSKTFVKETEKHKTGRANYVQIVTSRGVEQRGTLMTRSWVETGVHAGSSRRAGKAPGLRSREATAHF